MADNTITQDKEQITIGAAATYAEAIPILVAAYPALKKRFARAKVKLHLASAATGEGVPEIVAELAKLAGKRSD